MEAPHDRQPQLPGRFVTPPICRCSDAAVAGVGNHRTARKEQKIKPRWSRVSGCYFPVRDPERSTVVFSGRLEAEEDPQPGVLRGPAAIQDDSVQRSGARALVHDFRHLL